MDGRGLLDFINLVPGISSWDEHSEHFALLGRGQRGGFSGILRKVKKWEDDFLTKNCRRKPKQKGGRASFHDDIFS